VECVTIVFLVQRFLETAHSRLPTFEPRNGRVPCAAYDSNFGNAEL